MDWTWKWFVEVPPILSELSGLTVVIRLLLAVLVGGAVGWERGRRGRAAGLRTHILVCLGACLSALVGCYTADTMGLGGDPNRIAAQVVSGIGFLGVGTIMVGRSSQVTGLTTAAGLWTTAATGLGLGVGFYWASILTTLIILVAMTLLARLECRTRAQQIREQLYLELSNITSVQPFLDEIQSWDKDISIVPPRSGCAGQVGVEIVFSSHLSNDRMEQLRAMDAVQFIL